MAKFYSLCATNHINTSSPIFSGANPANSLRARTVLKELVRLENAGQKAARETFPATAADETTWVSQLAHTGAELQAALVKYLKEMDGVEGQSFSVSAIDGRINKISKKKKSEADTKGQGKISFLPARDADAKKLKTAEEEKDAEEGQGAADGRSKDL